LEAPLGVVVKNRFSTAHAPPSFAQGFANDRTLALPFRVLRKGGAGMKLHFYISNDDDAERCREALQSGNHIAIGGTDTLTGRSKSYAGCVLAMQAAYTESAGERWRVTMDSGDPAKGRSINGP